MRKLLPVLLFGLVSLLNACVNEETLNNAFSLGAHYTTSVILKECVERYDDLSADKTTAGALVSSGLKLKKDYFISINDPKRIEEAAETAASSLAYVKPNMTKQKCDAMIAAIINDGGVKKGIKEYYPD